MGQDSQSTDQARHRKRENGRPVESPNASSRPSVGFVERHYTVAEVATMWNLSPMQCEECSRTSKACSCLETTDYHARNAVILRFASRPPWSSECTGGFPRYRRPSHAKHLSKASHRLQTSPRGSQVS